jgi:CRP-like cAMP-binding protein
MHFLIGALHEKKFAENLECMSQVDMFHHWKENQLTSFLMSIEEMKFTRNQAIFKAGDVPDQLYFIKRGEVEV